MPVAAAPPAVQCDQALAVAHADATLAYRDLTRHRVEVRLENDGWHVEYSFRGTGRFHTGGGPHYVIDATTGEIVSRKYYQ
ncbi:MAG: hypothetical protein ACRC7O_17160 [Fimbriiglobus sp.]